ncbi:MAG: hypothetical protein V9H69_23725 [Anaerolineae bacterium]
MIGCVERLVAEERRFIESQTEAYSASAELQAADAQIAQEQQRATAQAGDLVALLQAANAYFQTHDHAAACPLCGSDERALGLADRVQQRLHGITTLIEALEHRAKTAQRLLAAQAVQDQQRLALTNAANALVKALHFEALPQMAALHPAFFMAAQAFQTCSESDLINHVRSLAAEADLCLDLLRAERELRQKRLALVEHLAASRRNP